jgi:hypothetical protein
MKSMPLPTSISVAKALVIDGTSVLSRDIVLVKSEPEA